MNPRIIKMHIKAHHEWLKEQDYLMWIQGKYMHDAIMVGLSRFASKNSNAKYPEQPYLEKAEEENKPIEDKTKAAENFMLRLQIMGANYERAQKEKDKDS